MAGASDMAAWRRQNSEPIAVDVQLHDGTALKGNVLIPRDKQLRDLLLSPDAFIEFDCFRLGATLLSKSAIRLIRLNSLPAADQLLKRQNAIDAADPFSILRVPRNADKDTVRKAYLELARTYHPDRFANQDLPPEMSEYVNAMARRVNTAFAEVQALFGGERGAAH
jgi:hypothetical protein